MVGGVDYFVIGIALLIFGYSSYELVISDLDPHLEGGEEKHTNILSVKSLHSLKNNLSNVIFMGLIVASFKKTIGFDMNNATDLLARCGSVAMLALSANDCSQPRSRSRVISQVSQSRPESGLTSGLFRDK